MSAQEPKTLEDIRNILILGAGTMGLRIGLQAAISGFDVTIYDINPDVFGHSKKTQQGILRGLGKRGKIDPKDVESIVERMTWTDDLESACKTADLVNESVIENLEIKKEVWKKVGALCPPHTILTTNTSYMKASMMAEDTGRPELFCAFHFHDVFLANVVDVMPHPGTAEWITPLLMDLGKSLNQTPIHIQKENHGYIFNSMLMAIIDAAGALVTKGVATPQDVDRSWMGNFKMAIGPFGMLDAVGLETAWHITSGLKTEKAQRFAALLKEMVDAGKLGVKTGEGFYKYPGPEFKDENFIEQI